MKRRFSIVVTALNPGEKLEETVRSILQQTYQNYEIVVKDGLSRDGSVDELECRYPEEPRLRIFREADRSIYEGMNQAIAHCEGEYLFFLNCGDRFYDANVLEQVDAFLSGSEEEIGIAYGNLYNETTGSQITPAPVMNDFACYRNVPCHQTCFYHYSMFEKRVYEPKYRVRGDYEHFLWCHFVQKAAIRYMDVIVSYYEGGGFSETKANVKRSKQEHREITAQYMSPWKRAGYRTILILTLAPLRSAIAGQPRLSRAYNRLKKFVYGKKRTKS